MYNEAHFQFLRDRVETRFGLPVNSSLRFIALARDIYDKTGESLSASTLKRFWGYVPTGSVASLSSLNIIARYAGWSDFASFCRDDTSRFLNTETLSARTLKDGDIVELRWDPGRIVTVRHTGENDFTVIRSVSSKLEIGDSFQISDFVVGLPMYIEHIMRGGEEMPPYMAGTTGGLTSCRII